MFGTIHGIVAGKNLKPTKTKQQRTRNGELQDVWFVRFHVWEEDRHQEKDDQGRFPRSLYQVILPEQEYRHKVFNYLAPGRQVAVTGDLTHRPAFGKSRKGDAVPYANPRLYATKVELLDSPPLTVSGKIFDTLVDNKVITTEDKETYQEKLEAIYSGIAEGAEEPRLIVDKANNQQSFENLS